MAERTRRRGNPPPRAAVTERQPRIVTSGDVSDGRARGDWQTKYPPRANWIIFIEALYLFLVIVGVVVLLFLFYADPYPRKIQRLLSINGGAFHVINIYAYAWLGGMLGGSLMAVKWLYYGVSKQIWHVDKWTWRFFTPIISGVLGFITVAIIYSGIFGFFKQEFVTVLSGSLAVGFLTGYFTDGAVRKLREVAEVIFGTREERR